MTEPTTLSEDGGRVEDKARQLRVQGHALRFARLLGWKALPGLPGQRLPALPLHPGGIRTKKRTVRPASPGELRGRCPQCAATYQYAAM